MVIGVVILAVIVTVIVMAAKRRADSASPYRVDRPPARERRVGPTRSPLEEKLETWVAEELIDADQADAILVHELEHAQGPTTRVPLVAEAVGYIGSGLVLAAVALLIGNRWDELSTPVRIISLAVPTVIAAFAGWWAGRGAEPALQRLGSVLWLLGVVGVAGVAAEVWVDAVHDGDPPDHHAALFVGSIALAAAVAAWWVRRVELQQLALFAAAVATALGVVDTMADAQDRSMSEAAVGVTLLVLGAGWVAASLAGRLPPPLLANVLGSATVLLGAQFVRADSAHAGLWLGLAASVLLMAAGVARSEVEILFIGTAGLFQWTPQIALFYLEDTFGAEATLFVIGALLIGVAVLFTRIYPWVTARERGRADT